MSALALPTAIAPAKASAPQGSTGAADATGFKGLLDTCLDKDAAPAEGEALPEVRPANDDAEATATTNVVMAPIPVPPAVVALPVSTLVAPEAEAAVAPAAEAPAGIDPSTLPQGSGEPAVAAAATTGVNPGSTPPVAVAPAPVETEAPEIDTLAPAPAEPAGTEAVADAVAATTTPAPLPAPLPAPPPLRALAERTSRPLDPPSDKTGDGSASASSPSDAKGAATVAPIAGSRTPPDRITGPSDAARKTAADMPGSDESSIDAAPAAETTAGSTSTAAQVRETGLSGLSRATIDATAQIAAQILRKLEGRSTRFEMALTPDHLGRVDVKLDIDAEGRLTARLAFDNPLAATDLRGRVDDLRRELEDAGFHLANDAFEFAERDSGSSGFDRGQDARHGQNRAFAAASRLSAEIDVAQPPRWMALSLSPSGVDLKV